jgi:hypothetical protein
LLLFFAGCPEAVQAEHLPSLQEAVFFGAQHAVMLRARAVMVRRRRVVFIG